MQQQHAVVNRERWLGLVMDELRPYFKEAGHPLPKNVRVSVGFPSRHARSGKVRAMGESWQSSVSLDKTYEVFVSPIEDDSVNAAAILTHELGHVADDFKHGHRVPFKRIVRAVGLDGPASATVAGSQFKRMMKPIIKLHGPYPHAKLDVMPEYRKQSTRMLKVYCKECGYTARTTHFWLDKEGAPLCPFGSKATPRHSLHGVMTVARSKNKTQPK